MMHADGGKIKLPAPGKLCHNRYGNLKVIVPFGMTLDLSLCMVTLTKEVRFEVGL